MKLKCDSCQAVFAPKVQAVPTDYGGEYQFFTCPQCNTEYPICTITRHGLSIRAQIHHFLPQISGRPDYAKRVAGLQKLMEREVRKGQRP